MAETSIQVPEDPFICPICLNLLKDPVTIPCGHSYCLSCITGCCDQGDQKRVYSCPQCKQTFTPRPVLGKNTMLAEVLEKLKETKLQAAQPVHRYTESGDVECDVCTGDQNKAIKSCLVCQISFCQNHLKEHDSFFQDERHEITEATGGPQEMICSQHDKPLEYFCRSDQQCICHLCMMDEHKNHETVTAAAERSENLSLSADSVPEDQNSIVDMIILELTTIADDLNRNCDLVRIPMIREYKPSVTDKYKFVSEYEVPSNERVQLATHYIEPVIIQRSKEQAEKYCHEYVRSAHASGTTTSCQLLSNDKNHNIRIDQLFSPDSDGNTPKTVILSGDSGSGKSLILKKIKLDWASGELYSENFNAVFLLKFDELKCISEEMSLIDLLSWSSSLTSDQISQSLQLTPEKVLFLIDGMDEFSFNPHFQKSSPTDPYQKPPTMDILNFLLRDFLLLESSVIVTTRYTAAAELSNLFKRPQRFTEIMGFSERGVQEYFHKFFQDELLFWKTYESVKKNESLLTTCSVPLLCWMICFCLKKHFTGGEHVMAELKTTTSIYVHFVSTLLEHHDQSQSVLKMLRSLGQLAERGIQNQQVFFDEKSMAEAGLDPDNALFLYKDDLKGKEKHTFFKFIHISFQEFFTALYYILLDEEDSWCKISELFNLMESEAIIYRSSPIFRGRLSNPTHSVMMFLCGLFNEKVSSSLFEKIKWTVPHNIKLKKRELKKKLIKRIPALTRKYGSELFALHCLYELQDERFVRKVLETHSFMDLSNISLRSTDCWVLLYCLQCCPHIRELNLMYCDLTSDKLKILQPALCMCETLRFSVEHLSEVGYLIQSLGESKILRELKVQEDENSAESLRWSLDLSVTHGDVLLSLSSSEKNPSFPAVLNISLTCSRSEITNTDWTLFSQTLSKAGKLAEDGFEEVGSEGVQSE